MKPNDDSRSRFKFTWSGGSTIGSGNIFIFHEQLHSLANERDENVKSEAEKLNGTFETMWRAQKNTKKLRNVLTGEICGEILNLMNGFRDIL